MPLLCARGGAKDRKRKQQSIPGHSFLFSYLQYLPLVGELILISAAADSLPFLPPPHVPVYPTLRSPSLSLSVAHWFPRGCHGRSRCSSWRLKTVLSQPSLSPSSSRSPFWRQQPVTTLRTARSGVRPLFKSTCPDSLNV